MPGCPGTSTSLAINVAATSAKAAALAKTVHASAIPNDKPPPHPPAPLPVRPPALEQPPAFTLTGWLNESIDHPANITLGSECELKDPSEDGGVVRCKGLDLKADEIRNHLEAGMQVTKLALTWDDNVSFVLDEELGIRRLKFGETLQEQLDDVDVDDALAKFDAAFTIMTLELSRLIPGLLEALGGEDRSAIVEE